MGDLIGAIYEPPALGLPTLAVVIDRKGDIIRAVTARSRLQAEAHLARMASELTNVVKKDDRDA